MKEQQFDGTTALILGASGGIGSAVARQISARGGAVGLSGRDEAKLEALATELPGRSKVLAGDATSAGDLERIVGDMQEEFGSIHILVHAVGSILLRSLHLTSEEQFRDTLERNLVSPFLAMKAVLPVMTKQKKGSIVTVSSVAGSTGLMNHEAISAAKGGLEAMVRSASMTYAKRGIRVNAVALGLVDTPMASFLTQSESGLKASLSLHPMGRIGTPDDVVGAILYLASPSSSWTTGAVLPVDGGMAAGMAL